METNLDTIIGQTPLFCQYGGQYQPQTAHVEIYADGNVIYEYNGEIGNAVPVSVWNGRVRRIVIPNNLSALGYHQLHDYITPELETIIAGMDEKWDGSNWVGTLTEAARESLEALEQQSANGDFEGFDCDEEALNALQAE